MCGFACGLTTTVLSAVLAVIIGVVGYAVLPGVIDNLIVANVVLIDDTIQLERFERVPFPLNFTVRVWNITNAEQVLNGAVPVMNEVGPFIYRLRVQRVIENVEEDELTYRLLYHFEFDDVASHPNRDDDMVTIVNVAYHAILQEAESTFPGLMSVINMGMNGIFGSLNSPIVTVRARDLLFDGIQICNNPGIVAAVACSQIRSLSQDAQNIAELEDGSLIFSLVGYRNATPGSEFVVYRGLGEPRDMGRVLSFNNLPHLLYWRDGEESRGSSVCNMINGTDSNIFGPFVDKKQSLYALNTDICRSVELRYQHDLEFEGIPVVRYSANEWFLSNDEGCFCINHTRGINRDNGCLLRGAMEMYTCVGANVVLTYPHFLYADATYTNGILGTRPVEHDHRIYVDVEPQSGTAVRAAKRAQFNVFMRPVSGIPATQALRTTLTPIMWIEEGMSLPEEYVNELKSKMITPLRLVEILIPTLLAVSAAVLILGVIILVRARTKSVSPVTSTPISTPAPDKY
ncbi:sensory neuron membrane protein 2 [Pectinophora gossypiella]|uniref:sensory neuron membrane protein 2 n=1 Tax=Pectinophora gossypiella TaxID=13191 RepID=UPI00214E279B|nr:sensory neuron membrane protein 2 [Pectinophora gossypiella]